MGIYYTIGVLCEGTGDAEGIANYVEGKFNRPYSDVYDNAINYDMVSWDSWYEDLLATSREFPDVLLDVTVRCESMYDEGNYSAMFKNGKGRSKVAQMVWPVIDEEELV